MRILALSNLYPNPYQPNRATFNRHQFRLLGELHPLRVIAPIAWTDERRERKKQGNLLPRSRTVHLDGLQVEHPKYLYPPKVLRSRYGWFFWRSVRKTFARAMSEFKPDIVFTPWVYPDGWAAVKLAKAAGLPVVLQSHGSDVLLLDQYPARLDPTVAALIAANGIVAVSHDISTHLQRLGIPESKIRVIHDGVDTSQFYPGDQALARIKLGITNAGPHLLFVGNLVHVKGIDRLLDTIRTLHQEGMNCTLHIIGQGPLLESLKEAVDRVGLKESVLFHGAKPHHELPDWYRAADIFVLPSRSEGVPNVLLEASACGTPWVATAVGGIPEITHLGRNKLVPLNQPETLPYYIRTMLTESFDGLHYPTKRREGAVKELETFLSEVHLQFYSNVRGRSVA
jgi:glycosyltransferase involved in cell wall biosynthesis